MQAALQLLAYVLLDAVLQGRLTLRNRRYVPMSEQKAINLDLHIISPTLFVLYTYAVAGLDWRLWLLALVLRLGLLDPVMNKVKGDPLFAVGSSALTDRLLRTLAGARASWLSGAVRLAAVAVAALLLSSCRTSQPARDAEAAVPAVPVAADGGAPGGKAPAAVKVSTPKDLAPESEALRVAKLPAKVQRRYRRNVRAAKPSVPLIQGRAAVNAPAATQVVASYKPRAAVVLADSGAVVTTAQSKNGPAVVGDGNDLRTTKESPAKYIVGGVLLLLAVGYGAYRLRKSLPV